MIAFIVVLAGTFAGVEQQAEAPWLVLTVRAAQPGGIVAADLDLAAVREALGLPEGAPLATPRAFLLEGEERVPVVVQYGPEDGGSARLALRLPQEVTEGRVALTFSPPPEGEAAETVEPDGPGPDMLVIERDGNRVAINNGHVRVVHDPAVQGGLPSQMTVVATGTVWDAFYLNDRVHDQELGSYFLRSDPEAQVRVIREGRLEAVVEVEARYMHDGAAPESNPRAIYRFTYRPGDPAIGVTAICTQDAPFAWEEHHLMEWNFPTRPFQQWAGGDPRQTGTMQGDDQTVVLPAWAALQAETDVIGLAGRGIRIYTGTPTYGQYVHGPWTPWESAQQVLTCTLWIDGTAGSVERLAAFAPAAGVDASVRVTTTEIDARREQNAAAVAALTDPRAQSLHRWMGALSDAALDAGRFTEVRTLLNRQGELLAQNAAEAEILAALSEQFSGRQMQISAGLGVMWAPPDQGAGLQSVYSLARNHELLAANQPSLWTVEAEGADGTSYTWTDRSDVLAAEAAQADGEMVVAWRGTGEAEGVTVTVRSVFQGDDNGERLSLSFGLDNASEKLTILETTFPRMALREIGGDPADDVFLSPVVSGALVYAPQLNGINVSGSYPSGWGSLQLGALYDAQGGAYVAAHDPVASTKTYRAQRSPAGDAVLVELEWPAPDASVRGNDIELPGACVIAAFGGDWFDATQIYRAWAEQHAEWWAQRGAWDRPDTPQWMKDVVVWAQTGGGPAEVVGPVKAFAEYMGVPTAVHWYNWHQIPFDDNYPHYFPAKDGYAQGVAELQQAGVRVMPYINGRLWDSDTEDFKEVALPAATKARDGSYYTEFYGSKQALVPMCPTTELWQNKVQEIVLRLLSPEFNVDGVYIDQVAAAAPRLCFDASHGHPLSGGHWWTTTGYWPMIGALQQKMQEQYPDKMITTECSAEPYTQVFDAYLTWHYQNQNMVPAVAAIYGGKIQFFGRAYNGTDVQAHRMKAAQSLVFGEQLGWIRPSIVTEQPEAAEYLRRCARVRHRLLPYLALGRMARPPRVTGAIPEVTADWAWSGPTMITDSALQSGAWRAEDGSVAFVFANSTMQALDFTWQFNPAQYGLAGVASAVRVTENGEEAMEEAPAAGERAVHLEPLAVEAYVLRTQPAG